MTQQRLSRWFPAHQEALGGPTIGFSHEVAKLLKKASDETRTDEHRPRRPSV